MFKNLFTTAYLFGPYGIEMSRSEKIFAIVSAVLLVVGIVVYVTKRLSKDRLYRKMAGRWSHVTFWIGLLGLVWAWLRYETVQYLSANVIVVIVYLVGIVWAACTLRYQFTTYKQMRMDYSKEEQKKKYL